MVGKPEWFPDWCGQACAIIASGPSTKSANLSALRGVVRVIAIKENFDLCPWADAVYGCDPSWWRNRNGLPEYDGLKLTFARDICDRFRGIYHVDIDKKTDQILMDNLGTVGSGGNSGFQALNLALQFGATRVLLIGYDMHVRNGAHWYGFNNGPGRTNPSWDNFKRWKEAFTASASKIRELGADVVNASATSDLKCFRKLTVDEALAEWGL